ncbi:DUF1656 domain-containing protein [Gluconacetobacter diazotrophicus]|uniref:Putative membrane protein n=1 Tax=Gluconacetobacter diazotrophicus (strain ATCC 49037 / DSM 5601 / CCUG 37298 / CIP 103539 / LMG 7603 / PAl5) TaxID=272568 RepID=A9HAL2_GLUDA|nr:DUF1656 domain-containing protein [Gluconacetobacter diazotrophicus]CAP54708.1 putative membrane protein [Gluconacetobacter diazotrophicus PA1 5]
MGPTVDIAGVQVSSFVIDAGLAVLTLLVLRPLLGTTFVQKRVWNVPLAEFGILICLVGFYVFLL